MSSLKQSNSKAVLFDGLSTQIHEPLLVVAHGDDHHQEEELEESRLDEAVFSSFKMSALLMGVLIGFLIQLSTLGANYLVMTIWGDDILTKSKQDIITTFATVWSFFTSAMAIIMLTLLRNIVSIAYTSILKKSEEMVDEMMLHVECRFVVGALTGVCTAWAMTDALVGLQTQIVYSIATLGLALTWCRAMMSCLRSQETTRNHDEPARHEIMII